MEEWIPEVGDWCVCTRQYNNVWYKGRVWQIHSIIHGSFNAVGGGGLRLRNSFRKAEPHEIPGYIPFEKESNYKYLIPLIKKINNYYERVCIT